MRSESVIWLSGLLFLVAGGCNPSPQPEELLPPEENTTVTPPETQPTPPPAPEQEVTLVSQGKPGTKTSWFFKGPTEVVSDSAYGGVFNEKNILVGSVGGTVLKSLVEFDLSDLPASALSARIEILCSVAESGNSSNTITLQRITEFWNWWGLGVNTVDPEPQQIGGTNFWFLKDEPSSEWLANDLPLPVPNEWYSIDITNLYNGWQNGIYPNYGIQLSLTAVTEENQWFAFPRNRRTTDSALRPRLVVTTLSSTPVVSFHCKLPLPGGKEWLLTTEAGGGDCGSSWVDPYHTDDPKYGSNHHSLDFDDLSREKGSETNVPVYAAASGRVVATNRTRPMPGNGYYLVLEHDYPYDGKLETGFTTWYLHLKESPLVEDGDEVIQGQQLGIVGNTGQLPNGESMGTHLHFGVRFNNSGGQNVSELSRVKMEGRLLKDYKIACENGVRTAFYFSTNRP